MCVAWPMRLIEILPDKFGIAQIDGVSRRIGVQLLDDPQVGDYVLVHAGYAIEKIAPEQAVEQLKLLEELKNNM